MFDLLLKDWTLVGVTVYRRAFACPNEGADKCVPARRGYLRVNVHLNVSTNCDSYFVPRKKDANASKLQRKNLG